MDTIDEAVNAMEVLTVGRLIEDLKVFDPDSQIQIGVRRLEMAIPITGLMNGSFADRKIALIMVDPYQVKAAFDYAAKMDRDQAAAQFVSATTDDSASNIILLN